MRRPYKIRILEDPSRERRTRLAELSKTVRAGLYLVPAEIVAECILRHLGLGLGLGKCRELWHQQR